MTKNKKKKITKPPIFKDWDLIQVDYDNGATPIELSKKYGLTPQQISNHATYAGWTKSKKSLVKLNQENKEKEIKKLLPKAFRAVNDVLDDDAASKKDKLKAADIVFELAGIKIQKTEINGNIDLLPIKFNIIPIESNVEL